MARGGGVGGAQRPPQQHTRSKGEQLVLAFLLAFLFGFFSAKQTNGKSKSKKRKENSCQSRKATKAKSRKTKTRKVEKQQKENSRSRKAAKAKKNAEAEKRQKQKHCKIRVKKKYKNNPETKRTSINMVDGSFCLFLFNSILHFPCGPSFVTLFLRLPCFHPSCLPHFLP